MDNSATLSAPTTGQGLGGGRARFEAACLWVLIAVLWFILCRHLSNEWSVNEQYSYGWFVPFFAAFLFWLRWEDRPDQDGPERPTSNAQLSAFNESSAGGTHHLVVFAFAFLLFLAILPLRLFEVGNPDWRPLAWIHAVIVVALTLLIIWRAGGTPWLKHFAFPICFILVAVPWISPVETPIVQGLMQVVATIASETANLFGIPAQLEGSVIRINSGVVGVNEACSGVRSLQTSLMIGLLFGELKRLSISRRIFLVFLAASVAFVANCGRAFFLVWIAATRNLSAVGQWHDTAGYAIVALVFVATIALATLLAKGKNTPTTVPASAFRIPHRVIPTSAILPAVIWLLFVEAVVQGWYRSHERNQIATAGWDVNWPEKAPGFRDLKIEENVRSTLRFDRGREATWSTQTTNQHASQPFAAAFMFFFRWEPGTTSILRARAHRPDVCLPNTGWRLTNDLGVRSYSLTNGSSLPFRHFTFVRPAAEKREISAHAFFCQREDRIPREKEDQFNLTTGLTSDWSRSDRLRVVREGLRNQGQQVLQVVLVSPQKLDAGAAEAEFAELVPQIVK